jgi:hypothetical protein
MNASASLYHARLGTLIMLAKDTERFKARSLNEWVTE